MASRDSDYNFSTIIQDSTLFVNAIGTFFCRGSIKNNVSVSDLLIVSDQDTIPSEFRDIIEALAHGTRLFDALYYFSLPKGQRPVISAAMRNDIPSSRQHDVIARAVFFQMFMVLTRGSPSMSDTSSAEGMVPKFLSSTMSLSDTPKNYASLICSFDLGLVDFRFIKQIDFSKLSAISRNRLSLGVAGYRNIAPFALFSPRSDASEDAKNAHEVVAKLARSPADWSIHPVTRSDAVTAYYGALNSTLCDLMVACFSKDQLTTMLNNKMIYSMPRSNPRATRWHGWTIGTMPHLREPIFREQGNRK